MAKAALPNHVSLLPDDAQGLAKIIVSATERINRLYSTIDVAYGLLKHHMRPGEEVEIDGKPYTYTDLFAESDTLWRAKMFRRFELVKKKLL